MEDYAVEKAANPDGKDGRVSQAKIAQPASQRWASLEKVFHVMLTKYPTLKAFWLDKRNTPFPLLDKQQEVRLGCVGREVPVRTTP